MPTSLGNAAPYISGTGTPDDVIDLPRNTGGYRPHTPRKPKPTGLDWDLLAPTCNVCGQRSVTVSTLSGRCGTCVCKADANRTHKTEPPTEGKQGKPTTRSSAPGARSTSSTTGRAPVAGPSTTERKDPVAVPETRQATATGPLIADTTLATFTTLRDQLAAAVEALDTFIHTHQQPTPPPAPPAPEPTPPPAAAPRKRRVIGRDPDTPRARRTPTTPAWAKPVDEAAICRAYVDDHDSSPVIAKRHGIQAKRVRAILDRHGIDRRDDRTTRSGGRNAKTLNDYDPQLVAEIRRLYVDEEQTTVEVATATGHSAKFVCKLLELAGVARRPAASVAGRKGRDQKLDDTKRGEICRRYTAGESSIQLASAYDVSSPTVLNVLRQHGIPIRTPAHQKPPVDLTDIQAHEIADLYRSGLHTLNELGARYGVRGERIRAVLVDQGVPIQTKGASRRLGQLIADLGVTAHDIKAWAVQTGHAEAITPGLVPRALIEAYAAAHPTTSQPEQETNP